MKTLAVTLEYPPQAGGIASYVYNFAKHSRDFVVYAPSVKGGEEFDRENKWKVIRQKPYFNFCWPRWTRMIFQIWKIIKSEDIKLIHVHNVLPSGYAAYFFKKILKIPYFVFVHGTDLEMAARNPFKRAMLKKICGGAEKIVANSEFLKKKLSVRLGNLKKEITIVYPCPADDFFEPSDAEELKKLRTQLALEGKEVIITVSRVAEGKGYPHLVRLMPKILEKVPNLAWIIIGDGPKKEAIMDLVRKNNLQNVVRYLGKLPLKKLPKYYQIADLFVLLTHPDESREESWGTVFLEAAASGLPVVAGRGGGVEEAVINLITGLIVDTYQTHGALSAVTDLLKQKEYAKSMGASARERALKEFRWEKQIEKLF